MLVTQSENNARGTLWCVCLDGQPSIQAPLLRFCSLPGAPPPPGFVSSLSLCLGALWMRSLLRRRWPRCSVDALASTTPMGMSMEPPRRCLDHVPDQHLVAHREHGHGLDKRWCATRSSSKRKASATSRLEVYHELLDGSLGRSAGAVNAVKDGPVQKRTQRRYSWPWPWRGGKGRRGGINTQHMFDRM